MNKDYIKLAEEFVRSDMTGMEKDAIREFARHLHLEAPNDRGEEKECCEDCRGHKKPHTCWTCHCEELPCHDKPEEVSEIRDPNKSTVINPNESTVSNPNKQINNISPKPIESWEKRFSQMISKSPIIYPNDLHEIKDFIRQLLRESIEKERRCNRDKC